MPLPCPKEVTLCLEQIAQGDRSAVDRLLPHIYADLREIAGGIFRGQPAEHTLQPTALVHEAYLRLAKPDGPNWENRGHFLRVAALAMRQLLADYARARVTDKRGGGRERLVLDDNTPVTEHGSGIDLVELDAALAKLDQLHKRQARILELRFLVGLTHEETAQVLGVSERTVRLDWMMARKWLRIELERPSKG